MPPPSIPICFLPKLLTSFSIPSLKNQYSNRSFLRFRKFELFTCTSLIRKVYRQIEESDRGQISKNLPSTFSLYFIFALLIDLCEMHRLFFAGYLTNTFFTGIIRLYACKQRKSILLSNFLIFLILLATDNEASKITVTYRRKSGGERYQSQTGE